VRSLSERTTTQAGSSCERGACVESPKRSTSFLSTSPSRPSGVGVPLKIPSAEEVKA